MKHKERFNPCFNGYSTLTTHLSSLSSFVNGSFNPCFNGYSTLTFLMFQIRLLLQSFNPCFNGYSTLTNREIFNAVFQPSFNPCFNGYSTLTLVRKIVTWEPLYSFNPCFNGYSTLTCYTRYTYGIFFCRFQSLF